MTQPQDYVNNLKQQLADAERQLEREQTTCQHDWSKIQYVPEHKEGYHIPAIKQGSDFQASCDVPAKTTPKWQKTCADCGLTLVTKRTKKEYASGKIDGCGGPQDVPDFAHATKVRSR